MKTYEDQLDTLMAMIEKRLSSLENNVSYMHSRLAELQESPEDGTDSEYVKYANAI